MTARLLALVLALVPVLRSPAAEVAAVLDGVVATGDGVRAVARIGCALFALGGVAAFVAAGSRRRGRP